MLRRTQVRANNKVDVGAPLLDPRTHPDRVSDLHRWKVLGRRQKRGLGTPEDSGWSVGVGARRSALLSLGHALSLLEDLQAVVLVGQLEGLR